MFHIYTLSPGEASEAQRDAMVRLVVAGGGIAEAAVRAGVPRAEALVLCIARGHVAGVAALKVPQPGYRAGLTSATKSGIALPPDRFPRELGYLAVEPALRRQGLGRILCTEALSLARGRGLFATTGLDVMRDHILPRLGFVAAGGIWQGQAEPVALMVRPGL
ncbi:MAG: GNAT family N-acetyltransferase [Rhodobacteraceae bacterium]|nr:GNAT family N-acetyltransferase [Paracoccaceae bacterium]